MFRGTDMSGRHGGQAHADAFRTLPRLAARAADDLNLEVSSLSACVGGGGKLPLYHSVGTRTGDRRSWPLTPRNRMADSDRRSTLLDSDENAAVIASGIGAGLVNQWRGSGGGRPEAQRRPGVVTMDGKADHGGCGGRLGARGGCGQGHARRWIEYCQRLAGLNLQLLGEVHMASVPAANEGGNARRRSCLGLTRSGAVMCAPPTLNVTVSPTALPVTVRKLVGTSTRPGPVYCAGLPVRSSAGTRAERGAGREGPVCQDGGL